MGAVRTRALRGLCLLLPVLLGSVLVVGSSASASPTPVGLGTATNFAILAGAGVSNTGVLTSITGDVGLSPAAGTAYSGITCANMVGTSKIFSINAAGPGGACNVQSAGTQVTTPRADELTSFTHISNLPGATPLANPDLTLAGSLGAGLYSFGAAATNLSGTLTLDAKNDPSSVWIFQASSSLITSTASAVTFTNLPAGTTSAQLACNVFWTVQSSATLNTSTQFVGTILALQDISLGANVNVTGRLLAGNNAGGSGAVTLITDTITRPAGCPTMAAGTGGTIASAPVAPAVPTGPRFTG